MVVWQERDYLGRTMRQQIIIYALLALSLAIFELAWGKTMKDAAIMFLAVFVMMSLFASISRIVCKFGESEQRER